MWSRAGFASPTGIPGISRGDACLPSLLRQRGCGNCNIRRREEVGGKPVLSLLPPAFTTLPPPSHIRCNTQGYQLELPRAHGEGTKGIPSSVCAPFNTDQSTGKVFPCPSPSFTEKNITHLTVLPCMLEITHINRVSNSYFWVTKRGNRIT